VSRVVASKTGEGAALSWRLMAIARTITTSIFCDERLRRELESNSKWDTGFQRGAFMWCGSIRGARVSSCGTEFGLWVSWIVARNWAALKSNFPTVPVDDIQIRHGKNDLVLATHGRSIWVLDDMTPIEKMDANVTASPLTFFPPRAATSWHLRNRRWSAGQKMFIAKNPPYGAIVSYYLKEACPRSQRRKTRTIRTRKMRGRKAEG